MDIKALLTITGNRKYISTGILLILLLISLGCETIRKPITIRHERTPSQGVAAGEKGAATVPETSRKEQNGNVAESVTEEVMKGFQEEVKTQVEEELNRVVNEVELIKIIREQVRSEVEELLQSEIKKAEMTAAAPEWTKRIRFSGDIRLRYEGNRFGESNADFAQPSNPVQIMNTRNDQDYFKYRVRFGADARVNSQMDAVIRLSTGNTSNPVSTNTTANDYMNKDNVLFDLAYLKWQPWKFLTINGGRIPNPWFSSDLVWDSDLNFEGLALSAKKPVTESFMPFLTAGVFPLQKYDFSEEGKWLTAGQIGFERKHRKGIGARVGASWYNFSNITGVLNDPLNPGLTDWTAPQFQQKGNTLFNISTDPAVYKMALASEFREFNLTGTFDIGIWDPYHIVLLGDYVKNLGFDKSDVALRTGNTGQTEDTAGYQIGISAGHQTTQEPRQWKAYLYYKRLEADAVVDAFTDSDIHLGGTNFTGWILGTDYALSKNSYLTLRWLTADEISGPPLAIDVFQVDITARF